MMPTPVSLGRKSTKDVGCHQDLIQDILTEFFAIGQKLTLKAFCYSVEEYQNVYHSVRRRIADNDTLKSVQIAQCKTEGFNERLSDMAIREVLGEVKCISQEFCCGLDNETVKEYCELVPNQTRYENSKGIMQGQEMRHERTSNHKYYENTGLGQYQKWKRPAL